MSANKPSDAEEEYFLREEVARRQREELEKARHMEQEEKEKQKQLHFMKCPKCGWDLEQMKLHGVDVDKCHHCGGLWLDEGELETLAQHYEPNLFQRIAQVFHPSKKE